ncbi:shikimate dehydrogenase [Sporohalobacter salinus]|uniref:shikimate dehydrogenase n=1 Tax=Sporohalobacter salinus TaxID=1494606 RepID=UPI00196043C8|nr:shikimate dehydrogenase [Sporohalobacter salinus]MBM7625028.1 putative amino acid dehydrogenase [Sporohalobacter salinus]
MERFGFLLHPLKVNDLARKFSISKRIPDSILKQIIRFMPQIKLSHATGIESKVGSKAEGWLVGCTLTSEQMLNLPVEQVLKQIISAAKKAERLGAKIIGLGAYTSIIGDGGRKVAEQVDVPVTTGNSYTVAAAIEAVKIAADKLNFSLRQAHLAVIGATGSIGEACVQLMSDEVNQISLVARDKSKLKRLAESIKSNYQLESVDYSTDIDKVLSKAEIVITVSSAIDNIIEPNKLKPGAIVCDVARPRDVARQLNKSRDDILVIEGGIVKLPGSVELNFDLGLPSGTVYACMAETIILSLEGRYEDYTLGKSVSLPKVKEIQQLADKHGFQLAGLRYFEEKIDQKRFEQVKQAVSAT